MPNEVYEFSGTVDVLIKCRVNTTIGGIDYKAGEPYTYLKDVEFTTRFTTNTKNSTSTSTVMHLRQGELGEILLNTIPLTEKIAKLVLKQDTDIIIKTIKESVVCWSDGELLLNTTPSTNEVFCYDSNFNLITCSLAVDKLLGDFEQNQQYLVFYDIDTNGQTYMFESPTYPYFEVQVFGKGNKDKVTNEVFMKFPKVALTSIPHLNNLGGGIISTDLNFKIIYSGNNDTPLIMFKQ